MIPELRPLLEGYVDGTLSPEELARLGDLLRRDPGARDAYINYLDLHAELQALSLGRRPQSVRPARRARLELVGVAAALLMAVGLLAILLPSREEGRRPGAPLRLPRPGRGDYLPYNVSRHDRLAVVPAPAGLRIDGDLSDWDLSGAFEARAAEPYGEAYRFRGAAMYDARALYLSATVVDPYPLRNAVDPGQAPVHPWKGGALQFRLANDPALGWPLYAEKRGLPGRDPDVGSRPADVSDRIAHAALWHFQPRDQACLHLAYGMDYHGERVNPPGFEGAYRLTPDGRGYTLEYAIPWELMGGRAPAPGEELAACVLLHWSEPDGRTWHGKLIEITNPGQRGLAGPEGAEYARAAIWGRARFLGKDDPR